MYQSLEPEPEGAIFSKRSVPQGSYSSPHDAGASMANWLKTNIQGVEKAVFGGICYVAHNGATPFYDNSYV